MFRFDDAMRDICFAIYTIRELCEIPEIQQHVKDTPFDYQKCYTLASCIGEFGYPPFKRSQAIDPQSCMKQVIQKFEAFGRALATLYKTDTSFKKRFDQIIATDFTHAGWDLKTADDVFLRTQSALDLSRKILKSVTPAATQ